MSEEDLWVSLDSCLELALRDPELCWAMTWSVIQDASVYGFPAVMVAAVTLLHDIGWGFPPPSQHSSDDA